MKKLIAILLTLVLVISMTACSAQTPETTPGATTAPAPTETEYTGFRVPSPMAWPDYSFDHTPTTDELRQMAVKAMRDMLSVQWCTEKKLSYNVEVLNRDLVMEPETIYAGMPYNGGDTGLVQWFSYYEPSTGRLLFKGSGEMLYESLGNSCATSVMWGWAAVCGSLPGIFPTYRMVPSNGVYPVGPYTFDPNLQSFRDYSTGKIIADNGKDVMFQSYANVLPADAVTSLEDAHAMMAIEKAHVEYTADGQIDGAKSYIMIQDQRGGTKKGYYQEEVNGNTLNYFGRTSYKYTFDDLYKKSYIPLTTADLMGDRTYEKAAVTFSGDACTTVDQLLAGSLNANFPICILKILLKDEAGTETVLKNSMLTNTQVNSGLARNYDMSECKQALTTTLKKNLVAGKTYTLTVWVAVSTGETFEPVKLTVKG